MEQGRFKHTEHLWPEFMELRLTEEEAAELRDLFSETVSYRDGICLLKEGSVWYWTAPGANDNTLMLLFEKWLRHRR